MEFRHQGTSRVESDDIAEGTGLLESYRKYTAHIADDGGYAKPESSINLPFDKSVLNSVREVVKKKQSAKLKYIIVIGIGGSNLGAKAIYDSLYGSLDILQSERFPKILFLDTNSATYLHHLQELILRVSGPEEVLVNAISKSGKTTETIANTEFIFEILREKFGEEVARERFVITTDVDSRLWTAAEEKEIDRLGVPELVGGRYSVFSAVGLFPLSVLGIDVEELLDGARQMRELCLKEIEENPALQSAFTLFYSFKGGRIINDNFFFNPELESLGKWYRELMGESIGKEKDVDGNVIRTGMTPTVSVGSADLHSMGQLYLGGPKDKVTTFVWSKNLAAKPPKVGGERLFPELVPVIEGKSSEDIMNAIREGVKTAYRKQGLPFMEIVLDSVDERSLGEFMQFKMVEMMYLGKLFNVNSFDQPNVESYKEETRKLLEQ